MQLLERYKEIVGDEVINELLQLANVLKGIRILHINSTKMGGGVAEILSSMIALTAELGLDVSWEVIRGNDDFFQCTKMFHNALQGYSESLPTPELLSNYEKMNRENAEELKNAIEKADIVFIHDPQPAMLIHSFPERKNHWVWRCHIDLSRPNRMVWKYLNNGIKKYDAAIFSLVDFVQQLPFPSYIVPPSIDPLSEKNIHLSTDEIMSCVNKFGLKLGFTTLLQVSRFDRFKDPLGVIEAYRLSKKFHKKLQLVLAGGSASDDPEGSVILERVNKAAKDDPDIYILNLAHEPRTINALQRSAHIILQKSIKEGFGLTVTEALWKKKPVIGGNTGGIRLQVVDHFTGYLVNSPQGAALRIRSLLQNPLLIESLGEKGHAFAKDHFLITRHLRDYLTLILSLKHGNPSRLQLQKSN